MGKCTKCGEEIQELFLGKIKGTIVRKPGKEKQYEVCFQCQKKLGSKDKILENIK